MKNMNIYMTGVGGQGIGLLSEILLRAADHAGFRVKAVDTHGLAQRGGVVVSQLRIGNQVHTPLIPEGEADLVIALERHEALRAMNLMSSPGSTLIYYKTVWQPLPVRLGKTPELSKEQLETSCAKREVRLFPVFAEDLEDVRMQNVVLLAHMDRLGLIEGIETGHYLQAMEDLLAGTILEENRSLFLRIRDGV